jgi:hypothetical protein
MVDSDGVSGLWKVSMGRGLASCLGILMFMDVQLLGCTGSRYFVSN